MGETQRADGKPGWDGGAAPCLQPLGLLRTGSGEDALLLVLAPAGTAGAALLYHVLAALVEDGLALGTPRERAAGSACAGRAGDSLWPRLRPTA